MKALGIVRNIDDLGRLVIPMEVRRTQGWKEQQPMEMFMDGDSLVIKAYGKEQEKVQMIAQLQNVHFITENEQAKQILENAIEFIKNGQ